MTETEATLKKIEEKSKEIKTISDNLSFDIIDIQSALADFATDAGLEFVHQKVYATTQPGPGGFQQLLGIKRVKGEFCVVSMNLGSGDYKPLNECSRRLKKYATKSFHVFIKAYADFLEEEEAEFVFIQKLAQQIKYAISQGWGANNGRGK